MKIDDRECEEAPQGSETGYGKGKVTNNGMRTGMGTEDEKRKGKGKGKGNVKGKGIVKHTPWGDEISCAVALQLQKEMAEADLNTEG